MTTDLLLFVLDFTLRKSFFWVPDLKGALESLESHTTVRDSLLYVLSMLYALYSMFMGYISWTVKGRFIDTLLI